MKPLKNLPVLFNLVVLATASYGFPNDERYIAAMQKNIEAIYQAKTIDEFQASVNAFERIAGAETNKWEPLYYAAFGNLMMCVQEEDGSKKDQYIDNAMSMIEKGKLISPEESELFALEGFALMMRVTVDPSSRGPRFAALAVQAYERALKLNPENPRAWALLAQMQYGTAEFFGSSTAEACGSLQQAISWFETFKSENPLAPQWGRSMADRLKEKCK